MKFEEKLIKLRKENAWSQEELAEKLNVTRQTISKWELGQTTPDMDNLTKIAELFGTTVNDLYDEKVNTDDINNANNKDTKHSNNTLKIVILVVILILALLGIGVIVLNKMFNKLTNQVEHKSVIEMFQENSISDLFNELFGKIGNFEQESFNSKFKTLYYGDVNGDFMGNFLDEIVKSNEENSNRIITLKYKDLETSNAQEIRSVKDKISNNKIYEVSYEYDENGYINKAIILREKLTDFAIDSFNSTFKNLYFGSQNGFFMSNCIDAVIKFNEENPDNNIIVSYDGTETSNSEELRNMKKQFKTETTYEISYEYNDNGLVNKAIITREKLTDFAIDSFNSTFKNLYFGSTNGFFMNGFIDAVIKSNEENPDNIITVSYGNTETSNSDELRNMKKQIKNGTTYEISYEYNEDGLINKANIGR